ncbi:MAG: hypothetical protein FWC11_02210 [Firmicutes bacterium]|nr:hypothetical protein [Bacillota bacterium]
MGQPQLKENFQTQQHYQHQQPTEQKKFKKLDTFSRSWILTQSAEKATQEDLEKALSKYTWVGQLEKGEKGGEQGYLHYQIYIENVRTIRFSTLKNKLPNAHIEERRGTRQQAYDYVTKERTRVGEVIGNGEIRLEEEQGKRNDLDGITMLLEEGANLDEIRNAFPKQFVRYGNGIERFKNSLIEQEQRSFLKKYRDMKITYIWGDSRVGKSRYVNLKYDYEVYSIGNYDKGMWDLYNGEKVVLFEEFHSDIKINDMLRWLDGNPVQLSARYRNKIACFNRVYITSNEPLSKQYPNIQTEKPKTYEAFLNRINYIWEIGKTSAPVSAKPDKGGKMSVEQITAFGAVDLDIF